MVLGYLRDSDAEGLAWRFPKKCAKSAKSVKSPSHVPACRCGWTRAKHQGAISCVEMCELSELSELSVLLRKFQRGSVRLNRLSAISSSFELEGDGKAAFFQRSMMVFLPPRGRAGVRSFVMPSCQRTD